MTILGNALLRGERVYFNRITRDDLPAMARMWADIDYIRHLMRRPAYPVTLEEMEAWYKEMSDEHAPPSFAIRTTDGDQFIGVCAFKDLRWASRHTFFWIGIGVREMQGRGYGADSLRVLLKYAFLEMNLNCVGLEVMGYNERAIGLYRKVGFQHDGSVRAYVYRDGAYYDMLYMSMVRDEWEARYGVDARRASLPQS